MRMSIASVLLFILAGAAFAQTPPDKASVERQIRELEKKDADAVLRGDFSVMERSWADDFTVNSPRNQVTQGKQKVLELIRAGNIGTYSLFQREIESITIHDAVAIVMGMETVKRTSKAAATTDTVRRRYMNVWTNRGGEWLLTARQANVVCEH